MNIFITGGSGFIGRKLVEVLRNKGHSVKMLSRHPASKALPGVQEVLGDLSSALCPFDQLVEDCEIIFHCAGEIRNTEMMRPLHVDATQRLLEAVHNEASRTGRTIHWVQLSSVGIYGPPREKANSERIVTEKTTHNPVGEYEITKSISDEMIMQACQDGLMTCSIVRPSNVIGKGMTNQSLRSMGTMIGRRLFFYIGRPGAIATYVHVDDVVEVLLRCGFEQCAKGEVFNVSNDCALEELVKSISIALKVRPPWMRFPEPVVRIFAGAAANIATIPLTRERIDVLVSRTSYPYQKLERVLGFKPEKSVPGCIAEAL